MSPTKKSDQYRQNGCPFCGKRFGEPRGLEYRARSDNVYCHTCKRVLPPEMSVQELQEIAALFKERPAGRRESSPVTPKKTLLSMPSEPERLSLPTKKALSFAAKLFAALRQLVLHS